MSQAENFTENNVHYSKQPSLYDKMQLPYAVAGYHI